MNTLSRDEHGRFLRKDGTSGRKGLRQGGRPFSARGFFRRLALPTRYAFLAPLIERRIAGLVDDKGGPDNLTAAEVALLDLYRRAHGASLLLLVEAHDRGYVRETRDGWDLHPGARDLLRFADLERRILADLGLERRAKPVDPMQAVRDAVAAAALEDAE